MKKYSRASLPLTIGIVLILTILLMKRLFIKSYSSDATLSFLAGLAVFFVCFLILKVVLKNKK
ncbi:MAG: hypothetical protein Q8904_09090 [Bacteroidota bacterium]|nr:hypothetical protein [Bacteroidota bacterium]